jgi:hypothetical protein
LAALVLASVAVAPVLAAGRSACCIKPQPAAHGCCSKMSATQALVPKGCCKAPVAPKPEVRAAAAPAALLLAAFELGSPAQSSIAIPDAVEIRLARRAHRAEGPDDSPPDLLSRIHTLLI